MTHQLLANTAILGLVRLLVTARTVAASSSEVEPYPASMSAVTGTSTAAPMRATRSTARSRGRRCPSGAPRLQATPPLVVARARAPAR